MALAGLRLEDMNNFLETHQDLTREFEPWLLGDLTHVRHYNHPPLEIPALVPVPDWSAEDDPHPDLPRGVMFVSSLHQEAALPRLRVTFPGYKSLAILHFKALC